MLIRSGRIPEALSALGTLERQAESDAHTLQRVAECYTHCGKHRMAYDVLTRAARQMPRDPHCLYALGAAAIAVGNIDEAEKLLSQVIGISPRDFDAWYNRSTLRRQTVQKNHVVEMERLLSAPSSSAGAISLNYALAKELEDLGQHSRSFACLKHGADARRRQMSYRVEMDVTAMSEIARAFDSSLLARAPSPEQGSGPIFVVGLPRSGTTLVDRVLSSHSAASSLGEIHDLPFAVTDAAGGVATKDNLIRRAAQADFPALGRDYTRRIAAYGEQAAWLIDKTPLNFLYLGLIRLSLPAAKIIHLRRHPLDSCYAMYKTLFRMGYPFSYDLSDLARYYIAYDALMSHWRRLLPNGFLDVQYENLVSEPERESRRIVEWCALQWEPQCLEFHRNTSPAATASAAQVREPMHTRSVGLWRHYATELEPLSSQLAAAGIDVT